MVIPGGTFRMGCMAGRDDVIAGGCTDAEKPAHEVTVAPFELSVYEITVGQFRAFVTAANYTTTAEAGDSCWSYDAGGLYGDVKGNYWQKTGYEQTDDHPVTCVSWLDAQAYFQWLNQQSHDKSKGEWRLPTEAEWEYAARGGAGRNSAFSWGDEEPVCDLSAPNGAQFAGCAPRPPVKAGSFTANQHPFGLFDMHGNAWEWVQDCWESDYNKTPTDGTAFEDCDAGASRVLRGGSWFHIPWYLRSALRSGLNPADRDRHSMDLLRDAPLDMGLGIKREAPRHF